MSAVSRRHETAGTRISAVRTRPLFACFGEAVLWIRIAKRQLRLAGDGDTVARSGFKLPLFGRLHRVGCEQL